MARVPDFTGWTSAEKTAALDAIKAEMLRRLGLGSIASGASQGQSVTMSKLSADELAAWQNALSDAINGDPIVQVRPVYTCPQ